MKIIDKLKLIWKDIDRPFLIHPSGKLIFEDLVNQEILDLSLIKSGDVVAIIGDFDPFSISTLLSLIDKKTIVVPLTKETKEQHKYFFDSALVDIVIEDKIITRIKHNSKNDLIDKLRLLQHAGLVLFSSGTTGRPKAILHDLTLFIRRFETPRPTMKTLNFLLFDHIGGLNTLFHTLFNKGTVVASKSRRIDDILKICFDNQIELLPTTPTFLRMMLMSGLITKKFPDSLKLITYGTERMDQPTLDKLCEFLPNVEFRQTFGMSELGIVRVKTKSRNSLFMKLGGEGIKTRVVNNVLEIHSQTRMLGYINAESPFDEDGWLNTGDIVEQKGEYLKIIGRSNEVINVGGLKFMASEIERVALQFENIELAKAVGKPNPITGQHVEITIQLVKNYDLDMVKLKAHFNSKLPNYMIPRRIKISTVSIGHRFKKG